MKFFAKVYNTNSNKKATRALPAANSTWTKKHQVGKLTDPTTTDTCTSV